MTIKYEVFDYKFKRIDEYLWIVDFLSDCSECFNDDESEQIGNWAATCVVGDRFWVKRVGLLIIAVDDKNRLTVVKKEQETSVPVNTQMLYIVAYLKPDEKWKKLRDVYKACVAAGISPPAKVLEGYDPINDTSKEPLVVTSDIGPYVYHNKATANGHIIHEVTIDVAAIPKDVLRLKVFQA